MQSISPVTSEQLLARGQESLIKFEIYVGTSWINLCDLDGKDYVESWSISLGGASMTPNPIGGKFSITLSNENSIFHPKHPTSPYKDYLKTGRKVRISIGAKYDGTEYYWQRMIGFMNKPVFETFEYKVSISGGDYMKLLEDTELRMPGNYWGTSQIFDSIASDGFVGSELYNEVDAMDINNEANNVANWTPSNCSFASFADGGAGSTYVGRVTNTQMEGSYVENPDVASAIEGEQYRIQFKYRRASGSTYPMKVSIYQGAVKVGGAVGLSSGTYESVTFYITAVSTAALKMRLEFYDENQEFRIDQISIWRFIPYWKRYYELPEASKGAYFVTLDGNPCWQGEEDEGWYYVESTRRVFFDINKEVENGTNNLIIYYFTTESPENAVADILVTAGLYADRAAALAAMEYTATGITIDRIWFEPGSSCLNAVKMLCERCDYRFYFKYDGTPVFKPKPTPGATAFSFTSQDHLESYFDYQDPAEIRNRIVIKGMKRAEPVNREETMPPELKGEDFDQDSIDEYGERTLTIDNHLFQDQTSIDNMCASLLAEYKDPKWYCDLEVPFNPVPLEMGDKISWPERLSPTLEITEEGVIRDIKINDFRVIYPCEIV